MKLVREQVLRSPAGRFIPFPKTRFIYVYIKLHLMEDPLYQVFSNKADIRTCGY